MAGEIRLPDIGDFKDVPVVEILVKPGQSVAKEDVLMTLESDKATLEVPAPAAGVIGEIKVKVGDKVSQGTLLATWASGGEAASAPAPAASRRPACRRCRPVRRRSAGGPPPSRRRAPTSNAKCWCSAPALAAIPPRSAPPISAPRWCWSNGDRRSAAFASTSAASRPRRCCTPPR